MIKIAVPTDEGITISRHFGQAAYFQVLSLEGCKVVASEIRKKTVHRHGEPHEGGSHPGFQMVEEISDCQVLISGGMGSPVYERAVKAGLKVVLTHQQDIDQAVQAYCSGKIDNDSGLVHVH